MPHDDLGFVAGTHNPSSLVHFLPNLASSYLGVFGHWLTFSSSFFFAPNVPALNASDMADLVVVLVVVVTSDVLGAVEDLFS